MEIFYYLKCKKKLLSKMKLQKWKRYNYFEVYQTFLISDVAGFETNCILYIIDYIGAYFFIFNVTEMLFVN